MPIRQPRYTKEEAAQRGKRIYEQSIRAQVEPDSTGQYVAIDIETGDWEIDTDQMVAGDRLRARLPDAQTWLTRVGYGYISRFGGCPRRRTLGTQCP